MMVNGVIATCLRCGSDVPARAIAAAISRNRNRVQVAYACQCGRHGSRYLSAESARAALALVEGRPSKPTAEDMLMAQWANDLGGELTIEVFEAEWAFENRNKKENNAKV